MAERIVVGLIVNPIAGMGGSVGLKGTDGADILSEAITRGATPLAAERTMRTLKVLLPAAEHLHLLVPPGAMGTDLLDGLEFEFEVIGTPSGDTSSATDTQKTAKSMHIAGASLILFAGGDGTARDIVEVIGDNVPIVGIPCGVKMYSGVFATSPEAAGHLACEFIDLIRAGTSRQGTLRVEVMDIDEADYRDGRLTAKLFGYALSPHIANRLQGPKMRSALTHDDAVMSAAAEIAGAMKPGHVYLIGPGTSAKAVMDALGVEGSLLGVDAIADRAVLGRDLTGSDIQGLANSKPISIVLGVIGGQGYVLGRGNQQISADVVAKVGRDGLIVISSEGKLAQLKGGRLFVDSGDPQLDKNLEGYIRVHTGAGRRMMMLLSAGH